MFRVIHRLQRIDSGDALSYPVEEATFDAAVSWMALHHIPDRPHLCGRIARAIGPNGGCYIEDLYMRTSFSSRDLEDVHQVLAGNSVTSIEEFTKDIRAAGLRLVEINDLTADVIRSLPNDKQCGKSIGEATHSNMVQIPMRP